MSPGENTTMIGKSVKITGDLSGTEDLVMDGELQGTIRLPGARLTVGAAARLYGDLGGKDIVIFGRLEGDIRATGRVELRSSAIVQGNIYAVSFSIEDGASFHGQIDPSRAQEPTPERSSVRASSSTPLTVVPVPRIAEVESAEPEPVSLFAQSEA